MIRRHHTTASRRLHGALIIVALCAPGVVLSEVTTGKPGALPVVGRIEQAIAGPFTLATAPPQAVAGMAQYSVSPSAYADENISVISTAPSVQALPTQTPPARINLVSGAKVTVPAVIPPAGSTTPNGINLAARTAQKFTLLADGGHREITSQGDTVAEILNENHIHVGEHDRVHPARNSAVPADHTIRVERVHTWTQRIYANIKVPVVRRKDANIARGKERIVAAGAAGMRETTIEYTAVDGRTATHRVVRQRISRAVKPRVVAIGTRTPLSGFSEFAARAFSRTEAMAHGALSMIATAYTAYCSSCSGTGRGATGMSVHRGVVAVDPRVIPLGSRLYIPGYGHAIAGDTGGDIVGRRIDLAFDSNAEAIQFGRRPITIYVLDKKSR